MDQKSYIQRQKNFRKKVRGIRTMIWFHLMKYYSGGLSASQLELFFEPEKFQHLEPVDQKPRLWDRYEHGEASPRPERVEMVALKYPETAIWFHHPIWNIFNFDSRSAIETDRIILGLAPEVSRHFLHLAERSSFELRFVKRIFYKNSEIFELLTKLSKKYPLDTLTVFILFLNEAVDMSYSGYFFNLKICSLTVLEQVFNLPQLQLLPPTVKEFFEAYVHAIPCKHVVFIDEVELIGKSLCHLGKRDDHFSYTRAYEMFLSLTNNDVV